MTRPITRWAQVATAIIGIGVAGCGKSAVKEEAKVAESDESAAPENSAPARPAAAPALTPAPAPAAAAAKAPAKSGAEELLSMGSGSPAAPAAAQNAQPGNAQGGGGQTQMPANYPRPGAVATGTAPGVAAAAGGAANAGTGANGMPANYPQSSGPGGGPGQGGGGGGQTQMPANYPQPGQNSGPGGPGGGGSNGEPGMAGGPGQGAARGMAGMMGGNGGGGAINNTVSDFTTGIKGAESFLSAVQAKDSKRLAEAVALHARLESSNAHKLMFEHVLDEAATADDLDKLARDFAGMQLVELGTRKGSGEQHIIVGKEDETQTTTRVLIVRKEKKGWKVQDYGGQRIIKIPVMRGQNQRGRGFGGGGVGAGGGGGAAGVN